MGGVRERAIAIGAAVALVGAIAGAAAFRAIAPAPVAPSAPARSARLIVDGARLVAGHAASRSVTALAAEGGAALWRTPVGCMPATLARSGDRVLVACEDTGELLVLDAGTGGLERRVVVGRSAFGVLVAGPRLFLTLPHEDTLLALRADTLTPIGRTGTGREPRGLAWHEGRLAVVHLLDASVRLFDPATLAAAGTIEIGQQAGLAESLTPGPARLHVPHQRLNVTALDRKFDSTVFPIVDALDVRTREPVRREALALDSVDTPVGQPLAVALSRDGSRLYTANAASDDVSIVDLTRGIGVGHVEVGGRPRDLALSADGTRLYTLNETTNDVSVIDVRAQRVTATFPLAVDPRPAAVRRGARLFGASRPLTIARDGWISCASCHLDGGMDGRTWSGTDEGVRNTTLIRGTRGTEPLHWSATRPDIASFQKTVHEVMAGTGLTAAELADLQAYVDSLESLPSPRRAADGALTRDAARGAAVFQASGCGTCHAGTALTDRALHDVGTGARFDTPSLRELWLTAPFLHDGRAPTLRSLFGDPTRHGGVMLSPTQVTELVAFLESLPLSTTEAARLLTRY